MKYDAIILKLQLLFFVFVRFDALLLNGGQVDIPDERYYVGEQHPELLRHEVHVDVLGHRPHFPVGNQERNESETQLFWQLFALSLK